MFFYLRKLLFSGFLQFQLKVILYEAKTTQNAMTDEQTEKCFTLSLGYLSLNRYLPEFISINECFFKLRKLLPSWCTSVHFDATLFALRASHLLTITNNFLTSYVKSDFGETGYLPACHVGLLFVISHHVLKVI